MFCPQCGQQQVSDEVRFCSRCGLPLGVVARVVEGGGHLAGLEAGKGRALTKRQRGVRLGTLVMIGGLGFGLVAVPLMAMKEDLFVLLPLAALVFVLGLMRILYASLLEDDAPRTPARGAAKGKTPPALEGAPARGAGLPPARGFPAADFARGHAQTAEMAAPPSVTDNTTRLLEEDEK